MVSAPWAQRPDEPDHGVFLLPGSRTRLLSRYFVRQVRFACAGHEKAVAVPQPFLLLGISHVMAGKITAIEVQKWRKDRVNVFIDDEYAFSSAGNPRR